LFTLIVTAIFLFEGRNSVAVIERYLGHTGGLKGFWIAPAFITIFFQNVFFDYVALFFIRQRLVEPSSKPVFALITGTLIGVLWVWLGILSRVATGFLLFPEEPNPTGVPIEFVFAGGLPGMAVFTWLPLFAFGILAIRALTPLSWIVAKAQWFLKGGSEHPLKAIGVVAAATVFVVAVALQTIFSA
jgi:hypothetical protein